jgi:DNA-directed RNA polymerase subunit RPC12/RpoP
VGQHTCADCGYDYPEDQLQATPVDQRRCPQCGSGRINAAAHAQTAIAVATAGTPSILITSNLWYSWMKVAIEHMRTARTARTAAAAPDIPSNEVSTWMSREFQASLVAVSASAHALDALYGSTVIPQAVRDMWKGKGTKRHGKIREALKQVFDTGQVNTKWAADFVWLFDLRDAALHAEEKLQPPVPHPLGTNTARENVDYSIESAERAVALAVSVLKWCADRPRPNLTDAVAWAGANRASIQELATFATLPAPVL